jgi:hypothetical protein
MDKIVKDGFCICEGDLTDFGDSCGCSIGKFINANRC